MEWGAKHPACIKLARMQRAGCIHLGPAACAGLGIQRLLSSVHGSHSEGGSGPILAILPQDAALVHAQHVQHDRGAEVDSAGEAIRKDVAAVEPAWLSPARMLCHCWILRGWVNCCRNAGRECTDWCSKDMLWQVTIRRHVNKGHAEGAGKFSQSRHILIILHAADS